MSKTIELTEEQWAALQSGEDVTIKAPKPAKWEPKLGCCFFDLQGHINHVPPHVRLPHYTWRKFGFVRDTRGQAERARQVAHEALIIDAYVAEYAPNYSPDWGNRGEKKYYISFSAKENFVFVDYNFGAWAPGVTYMPREVAEQLVADLNSGRVDLKYKES